MDTNDKKTKKRNICELNDNNYFYYLNPELDKLIKNKKKCKCNDCKINK
tara:strand:+ start:23 stop:169 length:147 start_codon:yes stop_codon:yes gene_type:complete